MRRTRLILAFIALAAAVSSGARPAAAHFCSFPVEIRVGEPVTINIGVAAEAKPVREVDIEIPAGFDFDESFGYLGYVGERRGKWVRFKGAEIAKYQCHHFALAGEATRKGRLVARIITTADDGTKTRFDDLNPASPFPAMQIFAGVPIPTDFGEDGGGGVPTRAAALVTIAVGAAVVVVAGVVWRRRGTMGR